MNRFSSERNIGVRWSGHGCSTSLIFGYDLGMDRPKKYAEHQFIGDKRTQVVYDLDTVENEAVIEELVESELVATFGPDTLAEARNRGYRLRSV